MILQDVCQIIQTYMGLTAGKVWIKGSKAFQPTDNTFSIAVGFMGLKSFGSSRTGVYVNSTVGMQEEVGTNMSGQVSIDIMGRTFDVVTRAPEIIQAMKSSMCKELQIKNGFMIAEVPSSMNDISGIDGAAIPYRFQVTFNVQFVSRKTGTVDYYTNFSSTVITED